MATGDIYLGSTLIYRPAKLSDQLPSKTLGDAANLATATARTTFTSTTDISTPHSTLGNWATIWSSTSEAMAGFYIMLTTASFVSATDSSVLLEFSTNAAPSSGDGDVLFGISVGYQVGFTNLLYVPCYLPSGTLGRLRARARGLALNKTISYTIIPVPVKANASPSPGTWFGFDRTTSRGTALATPGSLNAKGAWTALGVTAAAFSQIALFIQGNGGTSMNSSNVSVELGMDPAGGTSYSTLGPDVIYIANSAESFQIYGPNAFGVDIPSGARLAARYQRANANNAIDALVVCA